jgi:hypothetical protein
VEDYLTKENYGELSIEEKIDKLVFLLTIAETVSIYSSPKIIYPRKRDI